MMMFDLLLVFLALDIILSILVRLSLKLNYCISTVYFKHKQSRAER